MRTLGCLSLYNFHAVGTILIEFGIEIYYVKEQNIGYLVIKIIKKTF